jgi:hypothetical protein
MAMTDEVDLVEEYIGMLYQPPLKVLCWQCHWHIYDVTELKNNETLTLKASLFHPASPYIDPPGGEAKCPVCGHNFVGPEGELLTEAITEDEKEYKTLYNRIFRGVW